MLKGETGVILFLFCSVNKLNKGIYIKLSFSENFLLKHFALDLDLSYFILNYTKDYLIEIYFSFKTVKLSIVDVFYIDLKSVVLYYAYLSIFLFFVITIFSYRFRCYSTFWLIYHRVSGQ